MTDDEYLGQYLRTFVRHENKWFFVSTINRVGSQDDAFLFSETMAWEWDRDKNERGKCCWQQSGSTNSSTKHFMVVNNLLTHGKAEMEIDTD